MAKYDGLIIPRSYNDYLNKSQPAETIQVLKNTGIVPAAASADNELADKQYVNSTVGTNTANYIYKTEVGGDKVPFSSITELEAYTGTVTNNDYAFVTGTDENGNIYYDRYKASVTSDGVTWAKEYRLNNSSFTSDQWAAIQSGITAEKVAQYDAIAPQSIFNIVHPIGEIYVQFPTKKSAPELYAYGTWTDITETEYAGLFFRAAGGDAATFGDIQEEELPNAKGEAGIVQGRSSFKGVFFNNGNTNNSMWNSDNATAKIGFNLAQGETNSDGTYKDDTTRRVYKDGGHVTPRNTAIRIWERTA